MPETVDQVSTGYFGGFTSVDRLVESFQPANPENFVRMAKLIKHGHLREAANMHETSINNARMGEAMHTDDLPILLGGSINTFVREGFDSIEQNWKLCFPEVSYSDFRRNNLDVLIDLEVDNQDGGDRTLSGTMPMVPEGGMYPDARIEEDYEYSQLNTYGCVFSLTRRMFVDDNLRALQLIPRKLGVAMARTINAHVADVLEASASTSTAGSTMQDASRLFNTVAPTGSLINMYTAAHALTIANLVTYTGHFGNMATPQGRPMGNKPAWIIVPQELAVTADQLYGTNAMAPMRLIDGTATAGQVDNVYPANMVRPVVFTALTEAADWMLAADSAQYPTLEVGFLNGRSAPEVFSKNEAELDLHSADGMQYKIRLDFDAYAVDRRGVLRVDNTG